MKKSLKLLIFVLVMSLMFTSIGFAKPNNDKSNKPNKVNERVIKNKDEIKNVASEYGFDDSENIVEIIFSYNDNEEIPSLDIPEIRPLEWGAEEIYLKNIKSTEYKGSLIRSSWYSYPNGTMTVSESIATTWSTTAGLSAAFLTLELGFDVTKTIEVGDSQFVEVPRGESYNCKAYVNKEKTTFEVWEDDVFFDDKLGTGKTDRPIGVIFVIYNSAGEVVN